MGTRSNTRALQNFAWLTAALAGSIVAGIATYHIPILDSAEFEYIGRAIVHGTRLYSDVWDNKLPSVYLINALMQVAFGSAYAWHRAAEICVALGTLLLFAAVLHLEGVKKWAVGTFVLAAALFIVMVRSASELNLTEFYATFLIVLAIYFGLRNVPEWSGVALLCAATFWLPSILVVLPLAVRYKSKERIQFFAGLAAAALVYTGIAIWAFGVSNLAKLLQLIMLYEHRTFSGGDLTIPALLLRVYANVLLSGIGVLAFLLIGVLRRPTNTRETFAVLLVAVSAAGGFANLNLFPHYFVTMTMALTYAIFVFELPGFALGVRVLFSSLFALVVALKTFGALGEAYEETRMQVAHVWAVANAIRACTPAYAQIQIVGFEPGVYLAADRSSGRGYDFVTLLSVPSNTEAGAALHAAFNRSIAAAAAVVVTKPQYVEKEVRVTLDAMFANITAPALEPWRLYLKRDLAGNDACGSLAD